MRLENKKLSLISGVASLQVTSINSWPRCGTKKKGASGRVCLEVSIKRVTGVGTQDYYVVGGAFTRANMRCTTRSTQFSSDKQSVVGSWKKPWD